MTTDFLDDERRRLAYADRVETREREGEKRHAEFLDRVAAEIAARNPGYRVHDSTGHCRDRNCDYEVGGRWSCEYPENRYYTQPTLADGTGSHSRKEMDALVVLDALERLVCAFPELDRSLATLPQQRAWRAAKCVLVEAGRSVEPMPSSAGKDVE